MYKLYHHPFCPFSRKIRVLLREVKAEYTLHEVKFWTDDEELLSLNPAGSVPVLIDDGGNVLYGNSCLNEYFMESYELFGLQSKTIYEKALYRRSIDWFENLFFAEVTKPIFEEKILNFLNRSSAAPDSKKIRQANTSLVKHIAYLESLLENNYYLFDDRLTLADIAAATQVSMLDYVGSFNWEQSKAVKTWYSLVKSRASFQEILRDTIVNLPPQRDYANPDF
jgi:glutathione S-transferase